MNWRTSGWTLFPIIAIVLGDLPADALAADRRVR